AATALLLGPPLQHAQPLLEGALPALGRGVVRRGALGLDRRGRRSRRAGGGGAGRGPGRGGAAGGAVGAGVVHGGGQKAKPRPARTRVSSGETPTDAVSTIWST